MKHSLLRSLPLLAGILLFLSSCNSSEENKPADNMNPDSSNMNTPDNTATTATSTIVTTPQSMVLVRHKIKSYEGWKPVYDAHDSARLANGVHSYVIGRGWNDSNTLFVALRADDMAKAKTFSKDPSVKQAMQKSGVTGSPTMNFVTMTWQDTSKNPAELRSMTQFTVKDWATWEKNFQDGKQERLDNGVMDRAYGHDADDNKKVTLVVALSDTAKAFAYWKSDMLKERRKAGGVIGEPQRFVFRIVQRY